MLENFIRSRRLKIFLNDFIEFKLNIRGKIQEILMFCPKFGEMMRKHRATSFKSSL